MYVTISGGPGILGGNVSDADPKGKGKGPSQPWRRWPQDAPPGTLGAGELAKVKEVYMPHLFHFPNETADARARRYEEFFDKITAMQQMQTQIETMKDEVMLLSGLDREGDARLYKELAMAISHDVAKELATTEKDPRSTSPPFSYPPGRMPLVQQVEPKEQETEPKEQEIKPKPPQAAPGNDAHGLVKAPNPWEIKPKPPQAAPNEQAGKKKKQ